jgi:threonine synthase
MLKSQVISRSDRVACVLTGHGLKDPDATVYYHTGINTKLARPPVAEETWGMRANKPIRVADDLSAIVDAIGAAGDMDSSGASGYVPTSEDLPFVEY